MGTASSVPKSTVKRRKRAHDRTTPEANGDAVIEMTTSEAKSSEKQSEAKSEKSDEKEETNDGADDSEDEEDELPCYTESQVENMYACTRAVRTVRAYVVSKGWNQQRVLPAPVLFFGGLAMYFANEWFVDLLQSLCPGPWVVWGVEVVLLSISVGILLFKEDVAGAFFQDEQDERFNARCCGCCNRAGYVFRAYLKGRQIDYERIDTSTWFFAGVASFMAFQVIQGLLNLTVSSSLIRSLVYLGLLLLIVVGMASNKSIALALLTTPSAQENMHSPHKDGAHHSYKSSEKGHTAKHEPPPLESVRVDSTDTPQPPTPPQPPPPPLPPPPPPPKPARTPVAKGSVKPTAIGRKKKAENDKLQAWNALL
jgi:hypothetical protein